MSEATVVARGLTKRFRTRAASVDAVDGLSFAAGAGEIVGLLGPNGAGKTTALRMLATILTPTSGTATVSGFDVCSHPSKVREHIGFVATETGLYERFTARETLQFFGRITQLGDHEIARRTDELFDLLALGPVADRRVGSFSTGEKQKLSLARSIIHDPPVLILDEPTFGLDVMAARSVMDTVRTFRAQGRTILLSTHIMRVAEKLCDRIGILFGGRLRAMGTLDELRERFGGGDLEEVFFAAVSSNVSTSSASPLP